MSTGSNESNTKKGNVVVWQRQFLSIVRFLEGKLEPVTPWRHETCSSAARWDWAQVRCFVQVSITNSFDSASGEENILLLDVDNAIDTTIIIICSTLSTFQRKMSWREVKREALTLHKDIASFRTWCGRASC